MRWVHRHKPHTEFTQSGMEKSVSRLPHKQEIAGAEPAPATNPFNLFEGKRPIATVTAAPTTKETTVSFDLASLETRVKTDITGVYSALERDAHTKVGETILDTAKALLPFVPEGTAAENLINELVGVANQAHDAIHVAAGASDPQAAAADITSLVTDGETAVADVRATVDGQPVEGNAGAPVDVAPA